MGGVVLWGIMVMAVLAAGYTLLAVMSAPADAPPGAATAPGLAVKVEALWGVMAGVVLLMILTAVYWYLVSSGKNKSEAGQLVMWLVCAFALFGTAFVVLWRLGDAEGGAAPGRQPQQPQQPQQPARPQQPQQPQQPARPVPFRESSSAQTMVMVALMTVGALVTMLILVKFVDLIDRNTRLVQWLLLPMYRHRNRFEGARDEHIETNRSKGIDGVMAEAEGKAIVDLYEHNPWVAARYKAHQLASDEFERHYRNWGFLTAGLAKIKDVLTLAHTREVRRQLVEAQSWVLDRLKAAGRGDKEQEFREAYGVE